MKKRRSGTNTAKYTGKSVQGTGKSQPTAPSHSHKKGGAVMKPKKAKGPLDNRGKDNDRKRMA